MRKCWKECERKHVKNGGWREEGDINKNKRVL